jgi:hypothetical protein
MNQDTFAGGPQRPEETWSTTWLPFVDAEGLYVIDTDVGEREPSPVHVHWFYEPTLEPDLPSIGELITLWNDAIDQGAWRYDHNQHLWVADDEVLASSPAAKRGLI